MLRSDGVAELLVKKKFPPKCCLKSRETHSLAQNWWGEGACADAQRKNGSRCAGKGMQICFC